MPWATPAKASGDRLKMTCLLPPPWSTRFLGVPYRSNMLSAAETFSAPLDMGSSMTETRVAWAAGIMVVPSSRSMVPRRAGSVLRPLRRRAWRSWSIEREGKSSGPPRGGDSGWSVILGDYGGRRGSLSRGESGDGGNGGNGENGEKRVRVLQEGISLSPPGAARFWERGWVVSRICIWGRAKKSPARAGPCTMVIMLCKHEDSNPSPVPRSRRFHMLPAFP